MFSERIIGNIFIVTVIVTVRETLKKGNGVKFENLNQVVVVVLHDGGGGISELLVLSSCFAKSPQFYHFPF